MLLRKSRFVHQIPVGEGRILMLHAFNHMRLPADRDVALMVDFFEQPRDSVEACAALTKLISFTRDEIQRAIAGLIERQVLTDKLPDEELAAASTELSPTHGRDPGQLLERYRRSIKEGGASPWAAENALGMKDLTIGGQRVDAILFGDCDLQMESNFLRREAAQRGIDLHVAATFPDDVRFATEHKHDIVFIGALSARHNIVLNASPDDQPHAHYIAQAQRLIIQLRSHTQAPILIDNLPEPTVQPMGLAEQSLRGHRARFRLANLALTEMVASMPGVYVVDIAAAMAAKGTENLLDDGLFGFTHFGSPGWLLQRPEREKEAVHNIFPDVTPLAQSVGGDPYMRENALVAAHIDAMITVLGIHRKKCVIVDLDGTLWPGVLAETGSPFAWRPEISGVFSFVGLYFGLHEALLCLKKRGIVLACVSKNDEATVRELWTYPDHYPRERLLTPEDFVTWRVNWNDKVDNIRSIAEELGFSLDSFLFIDDHPVERDRVRQRLPEVDVWGEDPFALRRRLLNDPHLQTPNITEEAVSRSTMVKAQLERQHLRAEILDEAAYIASLNIHAEFEHLTPHSPRLARVEELFQRTTQFNTTGQKFSSNELEAMATSPNASIFALIVSDRFGDHGLVGAAIMKDGEILALAMSCRVLGMGVEHQFMRFILNEIKTKGLPFLFGRIIPTSRNTPVRNIYLDHGFSETEPGLWRLNF